MKVQRPQIDQIVKLDLSALHAVIWLITRFVGRRNVIDLMGFYSEFARTNLRRTRLRTEAANAKRFQSMFKDDPTIYFRASMSNMSRGACSYWNGLTA